MVCVKVWETVYSKVGASRALTVICSKFEVKNTGRIISFLRNSSKYLFLTKNFPCPVVAEVLKTKIFWDFTPWSNGKFLITF